MREWWDPRTAAGPMAEQMRELLEGFERAPQGGPFPSVDIHESGSSVVLTVEVPGVRREDIDLQVEGRHLTVRGEKRPTDLTEQSTVHHRERRFGSFERSFELGFAVDRESITADFGAGVLTIRLPKRAEAQARRIEVQAG